MNVLGLAIGMTVRQFVIGLLFGIVGGTLGKVAMGAIIGIGIGIPQLYALPQQVHQRRVWVLASVVGWAVGWSVGWNVGWAVFGVMGLSKVLFNPILMSFEK